MLFMGKLTNSYVTNYQRVYVRCIYIYIYIHISCETRRETTLCMYITLHMYLYRHGFLWFSYGYTHKIPQNPIKSQKPPIKSHVNHHFPILHHTASVIHLKRRSRWSRWSQRSQRLREDFVVLLSRQDGQGHFLQAILSTSAVWCWWKSKKMGVG